MECRTKRESRVITQGEPDIKGSAYIAFIKAQRSKQHKYSIKRVQITIYAYFPMDMFTKQYVVVHCGIRAV